MKRNLSHFAIAGLFSFGAIGLSAGVTAGKRGMPGEGIPGETPKAPLGASCHSDDPEKICIGVKVLAYSDDKGKPVVSQEDAGKNLTQINSIWQQCGISFQMDEYELADPKKFQLDYNPAESGEMAAIRKTFEDEDKFLVATTGAWNRAGSLGDTGANAWTSLPEEPPYGVVMEKSVGTFSNIIAHELGHYLNLLHASDRASLMNPVIYPNSDHLSKEECDTAREAAFSYWRRMFR